MSNQFASGRRAIAMCDVCGHQYKLSKLRPLTVKTKVTNVLACPQCWVPDHPQLLVGMFPVNDPQALRNPRTDTSYGVSGGSRDLQWGWRPVGGAEYAWAALTPNSLLLAVEVGTVTVTVA